MPVDDPTSRSRSEGGVATARRTRTQRPKRYKVLLHNDDFTTMEFVVDVLIRYFDKDETEAVFIMLLVHHTGVGVGGIYSREVAETKIAEVTELARRDGSPLRLTMEPA